ncbi:MAG: hypothetical protein U0183_12065 [Polyangiaceae bacterium]
MFVASNQLFTSSVAPESNLVRAALARGFTVTSLSFGPNRRFAMVAGGEITVQPSNPEIERTRRAAVASGMRGISFDQAIDRDEWAIRAGHDAWVYPFSSALTARAVDCQRENDRMSLIAFVPGRGYLVASNEKHLRDLTDIATDLERTFTPNATLWKRMTDLGVGALGYAILDDGKIRFARGYGETRKGRADSRRVDPESQFQAALARGRRLHRQPAERALHVPHGDAGVPALPPVDAGPRTPSRRVQQARGLRCARPRRSGQVCHAPPVAPGRHGLLRARGRRLVSAELARDPLPSSISHGGTQAGVRSHFIYDRTKRRGYVVFLHGAPDEAKLETMRSEVIAAMKRVLGL